MEFWVKHFEGPIGLIWIVWYAMISEGFEKLYKRYTQPYNRNLTLYLFVTDIWILQAFSSSWIMSFFLRVLNSESYRISFELIPQALFCKIIIYFFQFWDKTRNLHTRIEFSLPSSECIKKKQYQEKARFKKHNN